MVTPQQLAARIRELRARRGLTQEALAEAADVSCKTIRRIERGTISPSLITLQKLVSAFGLSASDMLGDQLEGHHEIAAMYRDLPPLEQEIAYVVLRSLSDHAAIHR
jgi:transcriptional regulator with XRE-family HTH domain